MDEIKEQIIKLLSNENLDSAHIEFWRNGDDKEKPDCLYKIDLKREYV